ncbi:TadE/TadG family type IV pilus assembly protein [Phycicoccus sonneratiae]|uniref:Pilus assembly protein n=1 Tax=Phycicoccus sonneratiae TaxID=2807628 RepID=A0ABS2CM44_9MICO|nr:TadE family protein [Phycicoccus sonneraticus]MBM6400955.1 pilus assembly protein [Phycicoccus sonneraticus]
MAVEAALVTPFFIMLLVGIIEFGMFFKDYLSVASAVRAGVRTASAEPRMSTYAQDAVNSVMAEGSAFNRGQVQQLWVYKANAANKFPSGASSFADCTTCVKFTWNGTSFAPTYSNWAAADQKACAKSATNTAGPDRVGVYMRVRHSAFTKFVFTNITIEESAVLSFEPKPSTQTCQP